MLAHAPSSDQGTIFIQVERGRLKAPAAPTFKTRAEGLAWLQDED
jgi:hypothetical protein